MTIKSSYFQMNKNEFNLYLEDLKKSSNTIHLLNDRYFFNQSSEVLELVLELNKKMMEFDSLINTFSEFSKKQIIQSFLIDEIKSTNMIENINSTRHDIFSIINKVSSSNDKKIISISNAYKELLNSKGSIISSLSDIRKEYDAILKDAISKKDLPDGIYFRKDNVYVSDGFNIIHNGTIGENKINEEMNCFIDLYNSNMDIFIKMILCHFIFENTHPFYDGNGRLGRFLFSNGLFLETKSLLSFIISSSLEKEKDKYYKAFKEANNKHEFFFLNSYFEIISNILIKQIDININNLKKKKSIIDNLKNNIHLTKSEQKIYDLLNEASILSYYGLSNEEIIKETNISKRTLIYTLNKFKEKDLIVNTKIGKITYHKFK